VGGGPAGGIFNILYEHGHARKQAGVFAPGDPGVDLLGLATRTLGVEKCQRVELGVGDGFEGGFDCIGGADFAAAYSVGEGRCVIEPRFQKTPPVGSLRWRRQPGKGACFPPEQSGAMKASHKFGARLPVDSMPPAPHPSKPQATLRYLG